jgi:hypothetical protein
MKRTRVLPEEVEDSFQTRRISCNNRDSGRQPYLRSHTVLLRLPILFPGMI